MSVLPDAPQATLLWNAGKAFCHFWTSVLWDLKAYHTDRIPKSGGVLMVANHQSYLDPVIVGVKIRRPISYMAKSGLFTNPYFGWLIRNLQAFPVRQGAGDVGAIRESIKRLQEGHILNIFPEGSRTENGKMLPIQPGVALLVRRAGVPVLPVAIDGSFEVWPKERKIPGHGKLRVLYGHPERLDHLTGEQIVQWIDQHLHELLAELKAKDRDE